MSGWPLALTIIFVTWAVVALVLVGALVYFAHKDY